MLGRPFRNSERAWLSLEASTHVIVHNAAWPDDTGSRIGPWLLEMGGTFVGDVEGASFYKLRGCSETERPSQVRDEPK